jgi:transposase
MTTDHETKQSVLTLTKLTLPETKRKPKRLSQAYIAKELNVHPRTVSNIIQKANISTASQRKGPPPQYDREKIVKEVHDSKELRNMKNEALAEHYGFSERTLRKILNPAGLGSYKKRIKPFINQINRMKRMHFAMEHIE